MRRRRPPPPPDPPLDATPPAPDRCPGVEIRAESLAIGVTLEDGTVVMRLAGALDRPGRTTLLRVARRAVRSSAGHVLVDCAGIEAHDDAGIDALASIAQLAGVLSVRLRDVDADLGRRLDEAGLAGRLHIQSPLEERVAWRAS